MTDPVNESTQTAADQFVWHPEYVGKSFESVKRELADDIQRDQRAYELALEQAEKEEFSAFNSVRELEKRWSDYDFGWFDQPPDSLADRIVAFERARDERQELISWQDWKAESIPQPGVAPVSERKPDWRENLSDEQRKRIASAMSIVIIVGLILVCILIYTLIR